MYFWSQHIRSAVEKDPHSPLAFHLSGIINFALQKYSTSKVPVAQSFMYMYLTALVYYRYAEAAEDFKKSHSKMRANVIDFTQLGCRFKFFAFEVR